MKNFLPFKDSNTNKLFNYFMKQEAEKSFHPGTRRRDGPMQIDASTKKKLRKKDVLCQVFRHNLLPLLQSGHSQVWNTWTRGGFDTSPLSKSWGSVIVQSFCACQKRFCTFPFIHLISRNILFLENGAKGTEGKVGKRTLLTSPTFMIAKNWSHKLLPFWMSRAPIMEFARPKGQLGQLSYLQ